MIDKGICDKVFIWNPSNCECECDKLCDVEEYLDYENCKCRKTLVDKLVEESSVTDDEVKMTKITFAKYENEWKSSCTLHIVLFSVFLFSVFLSVGIRNVFVYFYLHSKNEFITNINLSTETVIY